MPTTGGVAPGRRLCPRLPDQQSRPCYFILTQNPAGGKGRGRYGQVRNLLGSAAVTIAPARVFDLAIHRVSSWIFNCFVLEGDDGGSVLVDPGLPSTATAALAVVTAREPDQAIFSVSTHGPSDHVGGIPALLDRTTVEVHLPDGCRERRRWDSRSEILGMR